MMPSDRSTSRAVDAPSEPLPAVDLTQHSSHRPPDKRASQIARRIEADVIRRGWPVGQSLGSEQALQSRYDASRSVLREAVRLVEHHQVAQMRRGPNGGLFVSVPDAGPATRALAMYLEYLGTSIDDLLNARLLLEPLAAELAAERIDDEGIERLRATLRDEDHNAAAPSALQDEFHVLLAEQSKSPVLQVFIDVLMRLTTRYAQYSRLLAVNEAAETMARMHSDHSAIVEAVISGDSAQANVLTSRHVEEVTAWLHEHHIPARTRRRRRQRSRLPEGSAPRGKLAEVVAAAILEDIADSGWEIDSLFGTEVQLLERYGVSRSVLREAVRLLEYHSVARMRRGPRGGLVVTAPQPRASIDTIALYLEYRKPAPEDLQLVRVAIELDNVAKVVKNREQQPVQRFIETRSLEIEVASDQLGDPMRSGLEEFRFHTQLAELAGNSVLDVFLRILVELFRRHWADKVQMLPRAEDVAVVGHAHLRILDAIAGGDDSLAKYRTRRHLEATTSVWLQSPRPDDVALQRRYTSRPLTAPRST
jgi:DNA-binding FadR family transcriptional regulator